VEFDHPEDEVIPPVPTCAKYAFFVWTQPGPLIVL
jgi:hypothetical protein